MKSRQEQLVDGLMSCERRMHKGLGRRLAGEIALAEGSGGRVRWTLILFFRLRFCLRGHASEYVCAVGNPRGRFLGFVAG